MLPLLILMESSILNKNPSEFLALVQEISHVDVQPAYDNTK